MADPDRGQPARLGNALARAASELDLGTALGPRGVVLRTGDGVALVAGLDEVAYDELVRLDSGALGLAFDLLEGVCGVLLLQGEQHVRAGEGVVATGALPELPVGPAALGRILDPLGQPLDEGPSLPAQPRLPLLRRSPQLIEREGVHQPLHTGVLVVDAAIPIGRGQRELIIGDRNTGKSALAEDAVVAQRDTGVVCIYVVIGQAMSRALALRETLLRTGALTNTAIVTADASMPPGMRYLAPYAGASLAEWFRDRGGDALVVYDDLTKHADAYRELSLLLDRPPGREAFPGDIFFIHAELLERATARNAAAGGGSVTALPIVETTESDIASYIPTNAISITDGQIYLDTARFARNQRPAVDVGRSVSRIGAAAQPEALREAARNLRILYARFEELESLSRVGLELEAGVELEIVRGRLLRELLRQPRLHPRGVAEQVLTIVAVSEGWLDGVETEDASDAVAALLARLRAADPGLLGTLERGRLPEGDWRARLGTLARDLPPGSAEPASRPAADSHPTSSVDETAPAPKDPESSPEADA